MSIQGIDPRMIAETIRDASPRTADKAAPSGGADFGSVLTDAIQEARASEATSSDMATRFAAGDPSVGLHEVMIASEKSSIAVRYAVTVKNKAIEAYRELMNTPV